MSFQAYIDNIKAKTGLSPDDFVRLAEEKGLLGQDVKPSQILDWLREDYGLRRGHGMAIVGVLQSAARPSPRPEAALDQHFRGSRARWRPPYDALIAQVEDFGADVSVEIGKTYLSLLRKGRKFAIVQVTGDRLDVGIKLNHDPRSGRFEPSGSWNSMVTHRVRSSEPDQIDDEVERELRKAYELVGGRTTGSQR